MRKYYISFVQNCLLRFGHSQNMSQKLFNIHSLLVFPTPISNKNIFARFRNMVHRANVTVIVVRFSDFLLVIHSDPGFAANGLLRAVPGPGGSVLSERVATQHEQVLLQRRYKFICCKIYISILFMNIYMA